MDLLHDILVVEVQVRQNLQRYEGKYFSLFLFTGIPIHHNTNITSITKIDFLTSKEKLYQSSKLEKLDNEPGYIKDVEGIQTKEFSEFSSIGECGVTKHCYHDCSAANCSFIITWIPDEDEVVFNMTAKVEMNTDLAWIAIGLSADGTMVITRNLLYFSIFLKVLNNN